MSAVSGSGGLACPVPLCRGRLFVVGTYYNREHYIIVRHRKCNLCKKEVKSLERVLYENEINLFSASNKNGHTVTIHPDYEHLITDQLAVRLPTTNCPKCGKRMRPNNKYGICRKCYRVSDEYRADRRRRRKAQKEGHISQFSITCPCSTCGHADKAKTACTLSLPEAFTPEAEGCSAYIP